MIVLRKNKKRFYASLSLPKPLDPPSGRFAVQRCRYAMQEVKNFIEETYVNRGCPAEQSWKLIQNLELVHAVRR